MAMILQWVDLGVLRDKVYATTSRPSQGDLVPWENMVRDVDEICVYPARGCPFISHRLCDHILFFQRLASHYGKVINTCYAARPHLNLCKSKNGFFEQDFTERRLYIMPADYDRYVPSGFRMALQRGQCVECQEAIVCKSGAGQEDWSASGLQVMPVASHRYVAESYLPGRRLDFNQGSAGVYLRSGWSGQESWGTWTDGPSAELHLPLGQAPADGDCELVLKCQLIAPGRQEVRVLLNGNHIGVIGPYPEAAGRHLVTREMRFPFEGKLLRQHNVIVFVIERPVSPQELGLSKDPRKLGLGLVSLKILSTNSGVQEPVAPYVLGRRLSFSEDEVDPYLGRGWSGKENWGRWTEGKKAELLFGLNQPVKSDLQLVIEGHGLVDEKHQQRLIIQANGHTVAQMTLSAQSPSPSPTPVIIPRALVGETGILRISLSTPDAISPKELGINNDERLLAVAFRTVTVAPSTQDGPVQGDTNR